MKSVDDVEYYDANNGESVECPECGHEADLWIDAYNWGYKCHNISCLSFDCLGEA